MSRVVHFELPADDAERAVRFYSTVFGWKISKWEGPIDYWLVATGNKDQPGIDGAIMKRQRPLLAMVNSIEVPSVDDFVQKVVSNGGMVVLSKRPIPGVGYMAYCRDTEGNNFGLFQPDKSAR